MSRLFFKREGAPVGIEGDNAVGGGVGNPVGEDGAAVDVTEAAELGAKAWAVEDVVAKDEGDGVVADVVLADDEGLGKPAGFVLFKVGERDACLLYTSDAADE